MKKETTKFLAGFFLIASVALCLSAWSIVSRAPGVFLFACLIALFFFGLYKHRPIFPTTIVTREDLVTFLMPTGKSIEFRVGDKVHARKPLGRSSVSIGPFQLVNGATSVTMDEGYERFASLIRDLYRLFPGCKEELAYWTGIPE